MTTTPTPVEPSTAAETTAPAGIGRYVVWGLLLAVGPTLAVGIAFAVAVLVDGDTSGFLVGVALFTALAVGAAAAAGAVAGLLGWIGALSAARGTGSPWLRGAGAAIAVLLGALAAVALLSTGGGTFAPWMLGAAAAIAAGSGLVSALHERHARHTR